MGRHVASVGMRVTPQARRDRVAWQVQRPVRVLLDRRPGMRGRWWLTDHLLAPMFSSGAALDVTVAGARVATVAAGSAIGRQILSAGGFERAELAFLAEHARAGTTVVDVGANVGLICVPLAACRRDLCVVAFEPLQRNVEQLTAAQRRLGLGNLAVVAAAASDRAGRVPYADAGDGALAGVAGTGGSTDGEWEATTVDDWWRGAGEPAVSVVKIDVEGHEPAVLRGARQLLRHCRPLLVVEANDEQAREALVALLAPLGYEPTRPDGFGSHNLAFRPGPPPAR